MLNNLLEKLKDRPILSIVLCVALSEIIQLIVFLLSKKPPTFHYGIAVMALLVLFVTPVLLSIQKKRKNKETDSDKDHVQEEQ